jgi:hypothetical protein
MTKLTSEPKLIEENTLYRLDTCSFKPAPTGPTGPNAIEEKLSSPPLFTNKHLSKV